MIDRTAFERLRWFMMERELIREKKEAGELSPWTSDTHLHNWRFCNVDRCDDAVTRWIFEHYNTHRKSETLWFNLAIARFFNWPPTLAKLGYFDKWRPKYFCRTIAKLKMRGEKVYTGAYMIRAGTGDDALLPKHEYLANRVFTPLWKIRHERPADGNTCEDWDKFFARIYGMGDFMRNQIITDMKYSHHLDKAADWRSFVLAGPGTKRGLNRLYSKPLTSPWSVNVAANVLAKIRNDLLNSFNNHCMFERFKKIFKDLNNLSNCMCEFDKYERLRLGEGQPRSRYQPQGIT